jgi:hypothetical protein
MSDLQTVVDEIESKASDYRKAEQFDQTVDQYTDDLRSIKRSLGQVQRDLESLEFFTGVAVDVLEVDSDVPAVVTDARRDVRSLVERDETEFYRIVDEGRTGQFEQRVQQVHSEVNTARSAVEELLREEQREWNRRIESARNVHRIFGGSTEATRTFDDIESFVQREMWDEGNSITGLDSTWSGLIQSWRRVAIDWSTVQQRHDLSDDSIEVLQGLANGDRVRLGQLDGGVAGELLSISDLHGAIELTI